MSSDLSASSVICPLFQFFPAHGGQYIGILFPYIPAVLLIPQSGAALICLQLSADHPVPFLSESLLPVLKEFDLPKFLLPVRLLHQPGILRKFCPVGSLIHTFYQSASYGPQIFPLRFICSIQCALGNIVHHIRKDMRPTFPVQDAHANDIVQQIPAFLSGLFRRRLHAFHEGIECLHIGNIPAVCQCGSLEKILSSA